VLEAKFSVLVFLGLVLMGANHIRLRARHALCAVAYGMIWLIISIPWIIIAIFWGWILRLTGHYPRRGDITNPRNHPIA
jgi:hypothetical protein